MFASFANAQDRIEKFVSKAKNQATKNLLDPSSAQFRNLEVREKIGDKGKKHLHLCGEVNAKNEEERFLLSEEEKRNTILESTENKLRENQMFRNKQIDFQKQLLGGRAVRPAKKIRILIPAFKIFAWSC